MSNGRGSIPTSTTALVRVALFQPSQRPRVMKGDWLETSFGRCKVTGRLGQRHADVLDAILYRTERQRLMADGGIELLVDPAKVRKTLSESRYSHTQLEKLLTELRATTVVIEMPQLDFPIIGGLIDHVVPSSKARPNPLTGGERCLWRVRLGVVLVLLLQHDIKLYYDPAPIARLEHGISQAVARHVLSHATVPIGGWYMDTLIVAVSGPLSSQGMRDARRWLRRETDSLRKIGLVLDSDRIKRHTQSSSRNVVQAPGGVEQPPGTVA